MGSAVDAGIGGAGSAPSGDGDTEASESIADSPRPGNGSAVDRTIQIPPRNGTGDPPTANAEVQLWKVKPN